MADATTDSGLLGIDPAQLQAWMKQFGASDDEKKQARLQGILAAGLQLMGARKGQEMPAIGQAGLLGLGTYQSGLKELVAQRGTALTQAMAAQKLARDMQLSDMAMKIIRTGQMPGQQQSQPQTTPTPSGAPALGDVGGSSYVGMPQSSPAASNLPSGQNGSGSMYGIPASAAAMMMIPGLDKLGAAVAERTKPMSGRAGAPIYTFDQNGNPSIAIMPPKLPEGMQYSGGNASVVPGFIPSQTAITKAGEEARADYQRPVDVPVSSGGSVPIGFAKWLATQRAPQAPTQQPATPAYPGAPTAQQLNQGRGSILAQEYLDQAGKGGIDPALSREVAGLNAEQKAAFTAGVATGQKSTPAKPYFGEIPPYDPPKSIVGMPQSTQSKSQAEAYGKNSVEILNDINARGTAANNNMAAYKAMETLSEEVGRTGVTQPLLMKAGQIAIALGVDPKKVAEWTGVNVPPAEAYGQLLKAAAGQAVKTNIGQSRITNFEYGNFLSTIPNLGQTIPGRAAAISIMKGSAQHAMVEKLAADDWSRAHNGDMNGFPAWWDRTNQADKYYPSADQLRATLGGSNQPGTGGRTVRFGDLAQ